MNFHILQLIVATASPQFFYRIQHVRLQAKQSRYISRLEVMRGNLCFAGNPARTKRFRHSFYRRYKADRIVRPVCEISLIESYGLGCYTETESGLLFEFGFENRSFMINWLLGFGDKIKVIAPDDIIDELKSIAENILSQYK